MQGLLLILLSFAIWVGIWIFIVKKRGKFGKLAGNLIGATVGFLVATVFLGFVLPDLPQEEKSTVARAASAQPSAQTAQAAVPAKALDEITLLYINHKIYPNDPTICEAKRIGSRDIVGCRARGWGGDSQVHVWEYSNGKFKSINGSARSLAETKFSNEGAVEVSPLPLPSDIKVDEVVKAFAKG